MWVKDKGWVGGGEEGGSGDYLLGLEMTDSLLAPIGCGAVFCCWACA